MNRSVNSSVTLAISLVIFGLSGSWVAAILPLLFYDSQSPNFLIFLVMGIITILLTTLLFHIIDRLGMGFSRTAIALATIYNALMVTIKFGLVPTFLYAITGNALGNSTFVVISISVCTLALYATVFVALYAGFRAKFAERLKLGANMQSSRAAIRQHSKKSPSRKFNIAVIAVGVLLLFGFFVPIIFIYPFLFAQFLLYLVWILYNPIGFVILFMIGLAVFFAYKTFDDIEKKSLALRDASLLASFFWLGLSLILIYHAMSIVFLLTLFSIWPPKLYIVK